MSHARRRVRKSASAVRRTCSIRFWRVSRASFPHVTIRYGTELTGFEQDETGVRARLATDTGEEIIEADYLVGTDGAASTVRQVLDIPMSGNPALTYTTNAIFRCPGFNTLHDKGEFYRFIVIRPEGTFATIVAIDGRDRFRFSIVGNEEKRTYSEAEIRAAIITAVGRDFDFEISPSCPGCGASWWRTAMAGPASSSPAMPRI